MNLFSNLWTSWEYFLLIQGTDGGYKNVVFSKRKRTFLSNLKTLIDIDGISSGVLKDEETLTEQNRRLSIPDVDMDPNDLILEDELGNHNVLRYEESSLFELKLEQDPTIDNIILDGIDGASRINEGEFLLKENILDNELIQLEQSECP